MCGMLSRGELLNVTTVRRRGEEAVPPRVAASSFLRDNIAFSTNTYNLLVRQVVFSVRTI